MASLFPHTWIPPCLHDFLYEKCRTNEALEHYYFRDRTGLGDILLKGASIDHYLNERHISVP